MSNFKAILISRDEEKKQSVEVTELSDSDLMEGDVTVAVEATTVNYKDGLAITGKSPVVRHWPMVPGIDFAGKVIESSHSGFSEGDDVILNGFGVGETHWGAYAQKARVNGDWLIKRPEGISAKQAMSIGTAGYTAMLCVMASSFSNMNCPSFPRCSHTEDPNTYRMNQSYSACEIGALSSFLQHLVMTRWTSSVLAAKATSSADSGNAE